MRIIILFLTIIIFILIIIKGICNSINDSEESEIRKEIEYMTYTIQQNQKVIWTIEDRYGKESSNYSDDIHKMYCRAKRQNESFKEKIEELKRK